MLGLLVLLLGVAGMHAGLFTLGSGSGSPAPHPNAVSAATVTHHGPGDHHRAHTATHPCVFIEAAAILSIALVLLYQLGGTHATRLPLAGVWRRQRQRSPPPRTPSLAELSILRV